MKSIVLALISTFIFSNSIFATFYPIKPRPLKALIEESEIIVVARVISENYGPATADFHSATAYLEVKEVLQGKIPNKSIKVFYSPGLICPAPARYPEGQTVIAFLDKHEEGYTTHALSYGSKIVDKEALEHYKMRIKEMQTILKITDERFKRSQILDWLLRCIEHNSTRWEGIYELSPESDFMSFYDHGGKPNEIRPMLNSEQRQRIRTILLKEEELGYVEMGMVDLVLRTNDYEMLELLVKNLKNNELHLFEVEALMIRIYHITQDEYLRAILIDLDENRDFRNYDREEKRMKQLIEKFIKHLDQQ